MSYTITGSQGTLAIDPRNVEGWNFGQTAVRVPLLSSGDSTQDEVLQQGDEPPLDVKFEGQFLEYEDVLIMREYYRTKEIVVVSDPIEIEDHRCYVFEFSARRAMPTPWLWEWTAIFVETSADGPTTGSGSGS